MCQSTVRVKTKTPSWNQIFQTSQPPCGSKKEGKLYFILKEIKNEVQQVYYHKMYTLIAK